MIEITGFVVKMHNSDIRALLIINNIANSERFSLKNAKVFKISADKNIVSGKQGCT